MSKEKPTPKAPQNTKAIGIPMPYTELLATDFEATAGKMKNGLDVVKATFLSGNYAVHVTIPAKAAEDIGNLLVKSAKRAQSGLVTAQPGDLAKITNNGTKA